MKHVYVLVAIKWFFFLTIWFFFVSVSWARDPHTFNLVIYHQNVNGYKNWKRISIFFRFKTFLINKSWGVKCVQLRFVCLQPVFLIHIWLVDSNKNSSKLTKQKTCSKWVEKEWQFINAYIKQNQIRDRLL